MMNREHLTDEQIQEILDARLHHAAPVLPLHLGTCERCQKRLESFRKLYADLAADPGFALPPAFADSVLGKLPASRPFFWQRPPARIAMAIAASAVVMTGLLLLMNMRPLANGALQTVAALKSAFLPLGTRLSQVFSSLGTNARPFLIGGLGIFSASMLERLLRRQFLRHNH
jgi:hypothetical protein